MRNKSRRLWVMRSGRHEEAHDEFVKNRHLALGWRSLGDLARLDGTQEAFRRAFREKFCNHHPDQTPAAVRVKAGELFRFVHKLKPNDFVVYPSADHAHVYFGRVIGPYKFRLGQNPGFPHRRKVTWFRNLPKEAMSSKAKRAIKGRMTLYQPRKYRGALEAMLRGWGVI